MGVHIAEVALTACFLCTGKSTIVEVLALMGTFGFLWSSIQAAALESKQLRAMTWTPEVIYQPYCTNLLTTVHLHILLYS